MALSPDAEAPRTVGVILGIPGDHAHAVTREFLARLGEILMADKLERGDRADGGDLR